MHQHAHAPERATVPPPVLLAPDDWADREERHRRRADALLAGHRSRQRRGERHPVEDFLFTYYSHRPGRLRQWHPGVGAVLLGAAARPRLDRRHYAELTVTGPDGRAVTGVGVDAAALAAERGPTVEFVAALLRATRERPPHLGCFGLHEWAMVYRATPERVRHAGVPLRLGHEGTDRVVEEHRIRCTHYDAFRFFTPEARDHNRVRPTRDTQVVLEQPGCLHATMDLYKWCYKLVPAVSGELVLDCFELARDVRELDMRASPYDLSHHGYPPVRIETAEGKAAYVAAQREFAARATALRERLLEVCDRLAAVR